MGSSPRLPVRDRLAPASPAPRPHGGAGARRGPSGSPVLSPGNSPAPSAPPNPLFPSLCPKVDKPRRTHQAPGPLPERAPLGGAAEAGADGVARTAGQRPAAQPAPNQPRSSPRRASSRPGRGAGGSVTSRWISRDPAPQSQADGAAPQPRAPPRSRSVPLAPGRARPTAAASPSPATGAAGSAAAPAEAALASAAGRPASPPRLRPRRWSAGCPAPAPPATPPVIGRRGSAPATVRPHAAERSASVARLAVI